MKITFSDSAKEDILKILGYKIDQQGYIVDKDNVYVNDYIGNRVRVSEFAGVQKDFGIITNDFGCVVAFSDFMSLKESDKLKEKK